MVTKKTIVGLCVCACFAFAIGCGEEQMNEFDVLSAAGDIYFGSYVTPATEVSPNITIDDLLLLVNGDDAPYIIDWRSAEDYAAGHIIGAVNMALSDLDDNIDNLPKDQMIVNVCYTGQNASFATAVINLIGLDPAYTGLEARNLKFGMCSVSTDGSLPETDKWISAVAEDEFAESLEQTANTVDTVQEYPNPGTGATTLAGIIKANLDAAASGWNLKAADVFSATDNYFVINYWPEDQYLNPGHVPGAYQFSPKSSLKTDGKLNLLPADETVVIYCYTGQTSAQVTAYLRLLGYDAKSLLYGVNGFAFNLCPGTKYHEPENDYSSIVE